MRKYLSLLFMACISTLFAFAQQQRTLTGTVRDAGNKSLLPGASVTIKGSRQGVVTDEHGAFRINIPAGKVVLQALSVGYERQEIIVKPNDKEIHFRLSPSKAALDEVVVIGYATQSKRMVTGHYSAVQAAPSHYYANKEYNTENYSPINENDFHTATSQPLSTFSIDVDRAAYSNVRRFLNSGQLPPADAVRVEEMINYFDYQYKAPAGADPVAIYTDMAGCPWNPAHQLVRIALKGKTINADKLPASNLVFLIDVSGSMESPNKLPLVKHALKTLVEQLRPADKVSIVVYAGAAGLVLPATSGSEKTTILDALDKLQAGGSTAGGEGILLAYKTAAANFIREGNNRVILATDGDFNVGASSDGELQRMIEQEREKGVFLSVLGFGMGNYKDNKLEVLADKGNGNYAYIDNFEEARRTFV
ncbi:MAG TPA: von Willebrand factor type A domain-containing protein, partial [Chitinophaga sp.]